MFEGIYGKLCFSEKERSKVGRDYMERVMNEDYVCDHDEEGDVVECLVVCVCREEVLQSSNEMKT